MTAASGRACNELIELRANKKNSKLCRKLACSEDIKGYLILVLGRPLKHETIVTLRPGIS
jgi:hypothetical protein